MTRSQAQKLAEGSRVHFHADTTDQGTVIETGYNAVKIAWDNGQVGIVRHVESGDIHLVR